MQVLEAIAKRRSVRSFKPDPIPDDVLNRLLNAMRLAPSGGNTQPWKFVVVRDTITKASLADACAHHRRSGTERRQAFVSEAPAVIVACGSKWQAAMICRKEGRVTVAPGATVRAEVESGTIEHESTLLVDLAIALDHLTLAAVQEGLGTCWIMALDERRIKEILSVPDDVRAPALIAVGYPTAWPEPRPRKPLSEVVCYDRYS